MTRWLFFCLLFQSCGLHVVQFVNRDAQFGSFDSYAVLGLKGKAINLETDSTGIISRIEQHINYEMERRGYRLVSEDPDLILRYEIVSSQRVDNRNNNFIYFTPPPFSYRTITESVILLEMTQFDTKKLVWQASIDMKEHAKLTKRRDALKVAITNMFNTYLYRAGASDPDETLITK